jgi:hypothetical protein
VRVENEQNGKMLRLLDFIHSETMTTESLQDESETFSKGNKSKLPKSRDSISTTSSRDSCFLYKVSTHCRNNNSKP